MSENNSNIDTPGFRLKQVFRGHNGTINQIAWSPDGRLIASVADDATCIVWDIETGQSRYLLQKHITPLYCVAWSPDGKQLASGSYGPSIRVWDVATGTVLQRFRGHSKSIYSLAWTNDGQHLVSAGADKSICVWDIEKKQLRTKMKHHIDRVFCVAPSPNGYLLASGSKDTTIQIWKSPSAKIIRYLKGHTKGINALIWSLDNKYLISGSDDATIRIWNAQSWKEERILESSAAVTSISLSSDGKLLAASCADETIQIWRCDKWHIIGSLAKSDSYSWRSSSAFHPKLLQLATLSEGDHSINIWEYDTEALFSIAREKTSITYKNAKVLLLGDTGVGKSGLGIVLAGNRFEPTDSTHGRQVWTLDRDSVDLQTGDFETRETILWDLAGQPGYRLVHQLHLNEVTVALIVFDSRSETDPFSGVRYWVRALNQAVRIQGDSALPLTKFLVAARTDRGGIGVSQARIEEMCQELGIDRYFHTSAKEGWGIEELREAIKSSVDWGSLAKVNSSRLFQTIKSYLLSLKTSGHLLFTLKDLYQTFLNNLSSDSDSTSLYSQFKTAIGRVESRGLIRHLSFGSLVLLQPELLDGYASALVNAARFEPDGMGSIFEEDAHRGRFRMSADERIRDKEQERLLLIATIEDMIKQELALREYATDGVLLVFPSEFTRENPSLPVPNGQSVIFRFHGPVNNIYTTLVVRLSYSGFFDNKEMWKNAAVFTASAGGECGLFLHYEGDGVGELTTFFNEQASHQTRMQFEEYTYSHLVRKVSFDRVEKRKILVCPACGTPVPQRHVEVREARGFDFVMCSVCYPEDEVHIPFVEPVEELDSKLQSDLEAMDQAADAERDRETAVSVIRGKLATNDYDVFLCFNNEDRAKVKNIGNALRVMGILPWLDEWEQRPGLPWQESLEEDIEHIKSVAIFVGSDGKGPWENNEMMLYLRQFARRKVPLIPISFSDENIPTDLPVFLQGVNWISFSQDNSDPIQQLIWGITGEREYLEASKSKTSVSEMLSKTSPTNTENLEPDIKTEKQKLLNRLGASKIGVIIVIVKMFDESQVGTIHRMVDFVESDNSSGQDKQVLLDVAYTTVDVLSKHWGIKKLPPNLRTIAEHVQRNNFTLEDFTSDEAVKMSLPFVMLAMTFKSSFYLHHELKIRIEKLWKSFFLNDQVSFRKKEILLGDAMMELSPELTKNALVFLFDIGRWAAAELKERWTLARKDMSMPVVDLSQKSESTAEQTKDMLEELVRDQGQAKIEQTMELIQRKFNLVQEWQQIKVDNEEEYNRQLITRATLRIRHQDLDKKISDTLIDIEQRFHELGLQIYKEQMI